MEVARNNLPNVNFLREVRKICNKFKIILIFDECEELVLEDVMVNTPYHRSRTRYDNAW